MWRRTAAARVEQITHAKRLTRRVVTFATTSVRQRSGSGGRYRRPALARNFGPSQHVRVDQRRIRADSFDPSPAGARGANWAAVRAKAAPSGRPSVGPCPRLRPNSAACTARPTAQLHQQRRPHHRPQERSHNHLRAMPMAVADIRALGRDDRILRSRRLCCPSRHAHSRVHGAPRGPSAAAQDRFVGWVPEWRRGGSFDSLRSSEWRYSRRSPQRRAAPASWAIAAAGRRWTGRARAPSQRCTGRPSAHHSPLTTSATPRWCRDASARRPAVSPHAMAATRQRRSARRPSRRRTNRLAGSG
jgi:hypothetical protein